MFCHNFEIKKYEDLLGSKVFVLGHFYQTILRLINQKSTILFLFLHLEK